jgi:hypothetical protein
MGVYSLDIVLTGLLYLIMGVRYKLNVKLESIALCPSFFKSQEYVWVRNYYLLTKDENNS